MFVVVVFCFVCFLLKNDSVGLKAMRKVLHQEAVEITFTIPNIAGKKYVICFLINVLPGGEGDISKFYFKLSLSIEIN